MILKGRDLLTSAFVQSKHWVSDDFGCSAAWNVSDHVKTYFLDVGRVNHDLGMIGDVSIQRLCAPQTTQVHSAGRATAGVGEVIGTQP